MFFKFEKRILRKPANMYMQVVIIALKRRNKVPRNCCDYVAASTESTAECTVELDCMDSIMLPPIT